MLSKPLRTCVSAVLVLGMLLAGCANAEPADLESLGLAVAADIQPGERFELTAAKDPDISITNVTAPAGVTATVTEPNEQTVTLSVEVDPDTPLGTYILLLRTDRNGTGAELEWPFDVVDADAGTPEDAVVSPEDIRDRVAAALASSDAPALQALWPDASWDTLGVAVLGSFVPAEEVRECQPFDDGRTTCFIFEQGTATVLGLTLDLVGPEGWTITAVSLDSAD